MKITMNGVGNWFQLSVSVIMSANDVTKTLYKRSKLLNFDEINRNIIQTAAVLLSRHSVDTFSGLLGMIVDKFCN